MKSNNSVFISHASADNTFVDRLHADLTASSIRCWYDKFDLPLGSSIPGEINKGIAGAKFMLIVLSPAAIESRWVREELNAGLMRQVQSDGTFVIPALREDCEIPALLSHRRYADFRRSYSEGLNDILSFLGICADTQRAVGKNLFPLPSGHGGDGTEEGSTLFLHSRRFDKSFSFLFDLSRSASELIDFLVSELALPWEKGDDKLGMRWSFSYGLALEDKSLSLGKPLLQSGVRAESTLMLRINARYEDLFEKEIQEYKDKMFLRTQEQLARMNRLQEAIRDPERTRRGTLRASANSCFSHLST